MSFDDMQKTLKEARIVITHGGPSSFIEALQFGKVPIVVPRREKYNESRSPPPPRGVRRSELPVS